MEAFDKLSWVSKIGHDRFPFLTLIGEWSEKRQHFAMYQKDMPELVCAFNKRTKQAHKGNPQLLKTAPFPELRLASACEGLANCVYGICEIAASFANKASQGQIPASFNAIQKKVREGKLDEGLFCGVTNLEWYARIREIRTEWTHHSTVFIGENDNGPLVVVQPLRRQTDKIMLPKKVLLRVQDLIEWSGKAIHVVDYFGLEVFLRFVLPKFDLETEVFEPARDDDGFYVIRPDGSLSGSRVKVRDYFQHGGVG